MPSTSGARPKTCCGLGEEGSSSTEVFRVEMDELTALVSLGILLS